jgi:hypothetical protein
MIRVKNNVIAPSSAQLWRKALGNREDILLDSKEMSSLHFGLDVFYQQF